MIIMGASILALLGTGILITCSKKTEVRSSKTKEIMYHCPMHPNYISHEPGKCPICGMDLVPIPSSEPQKDANTGIGRVLYYRDAMNPSFTSDKPGKAPDGMALVPVYEGENSGNGASVKIDPAMVQSAGVQTEKAAVRSLTKDIRTSALVAADERRVTTITTKNAGYIEKLYVNYTGQPVKKGQPLYSIYSQELVSAQAEYLQVFKNAAGGDSGQLLRSARQRLLNWDITEEQIGELEKRGETEKTITVVSPAAGIVAEKMVVEGQSIEPGMQLYKVIDYSNVWVEGEIYQQDIPLVHVGQHGIIELDYSSSGQFDGTVTYIAPELNRESKTLMIRLELANTPDLKIKPGMNATVTIHSVMNKNIVTVSEQAVIHSGVQTLVVIAKGDGYFEPREVKIGQTAGGYTEVVEGLTEGEEIVTSSQFLIDSESNLKTAIMKMNH